MQSAVLERKRGIINDRPGILLNRGTEIKAAIAEMSRRRIGAWNARLNKAVKSSGEQSHLRRG